MEEFTKLQKLQKFQEMQNIDEAVYVVDIDNIPVSEFAPEQELVTTLLTFCVQVKLWHWQTLSFSAHKALDWYNDELATQKDLFVEAMLGYLGDNRLPVQIEGLEKFVNFDVAVALLKMDEFMERLIAARDFFEGKADLQNIIDEMCASVNKLKYLISLR